MDIRSRICRSATALVLSPSSTGAPRKVCECVISISLTFWLNQGLLFMLLPSHVSLGCWSLLQSLLIGNLRVDTGGSVRNSHHGVSQQELAATAEYIASRVEELLQAKLELRIDCVDDRRAGVGWWPSWLFGDLVGLPGCS